MKITIPFYFLLFIALNTTAQETIIIPDIGLEECLIDLDIDSNGLNGNILVSDAKYAVNLNINDPITNKLLPNVHSKIKDLTGLESFPNLKRLDCFGNNITKIDLSKSTSITFLNCSENKINSLDLSNNNQLVYVSCDSNNLESLILGNNPNLETLYASYNKLTNLDVKACTKLETLDTTTNRLKNILVNDTQLNNTPEGWYKDATANYTTTINNVQKAPVLAAKKTVETVRSPQTTRANNNTVSAESTASHYEKFQFSVVAEYDKLVLETTHTQSKKDNLQQKYSLNAEQLNQWIAKYSNLTTNKNSLKTTDIGAPEKYSTIYYSKFKKLAVTEYEQAIFNAAYLQSKKEEIQEKYHLNAEQFSKWITLLGTPAFKAKTMQLAENPKNYYDKFKKSVVREYENLVLNSIHLQKKKKEVQQKYKITASQLNQWINKYSTVRKL
ncbi:leucine-rich repeat domain-containing protein [Tenacibaculum finnmarkense]|uniref:leucine-rich repeat domain-containing protein n=1 Tax=Tenacibaculum finnmarkense TaxID=2781243 RepID=UPI001EFB281A|nr:hypothetical protein [Tenacibaculum finnmarkense]MCG8236624.1 hypothetical protein [Tenacibaculum finnmarkense genomovar ulcerans]MCG8749842.1 leucine-rich repeat domain-containing protein [Tenacibaculum finnmarkense]MCG8755067.1 leucine-rich repeat domain-containing protein [Tenacibaculum finnmarkense]MCG8783442.1 leucine-rich repeat domain-containing protein [Tenacibaculum finnmarkense]MCG8830815.1 leucine-rich repeat domain-containing protein [Tenacibaculum finnmarkense]